MRICAVECAEMLGETLIWGSHLQMAPQSKFSPSEPLPSFPPLQARFSSQFLYLLLYSLWACSRRWGSPIIDLHALFMRMRPLSINIRGSRHTTQEGCEESHDPERTCISRFVRPLFRLGVFFPRFITSGSIWSITKRVQVLTSPCHFLVLSASNM